MGLAHMISLAYKDEITVLERKFIFTFNNFKYKTACRVKLFITKTEVHMEFIEKKRILFLGLPITFTKYTIKEDVITIDAGLLKTIQDDCYMYKVQDVTLSRSLCEKILGLGTVICRTGDITDPTLSLVHIKHSQEIKDYILTQSESERRKRRTLNTLDIGVEDDIDTN